MVSNKWAELFYHWEQRNVGLKHIGAEILKKLINTWIRGWIQRETHKKIHDVLQDNRLQIHERFTASWSEFHRIGHETLHIKFIISKCTIKWKLKKPTDNLLQSAMLSYCIRSRNSQLETKWTHRAVKTTHFRREFGVQQQILIRNQSAPPYLTVRSDFHEPGCNQI